MDDGHAVSTAYPARQQPKQPSPLMAEAFSPMYVVFTRRHSDVFTTKTFSLRCRNSDSVPMTLQVECTHHLRYLRHERMGYEEYDFHGV